MSTIRRSDNGQMPGQIEELRELRVLVKYLRYTLSIIREKNVYEHLNAGDRDPYHVPWKLIPAGESDAVQARIEITDPGFDPEKVVFASPQGTQYKYVYDPKNRTYTLTVPGGADNDIQEIYALNRLSGENYKTLGKLNVISYSKQTPKVKVVNVNGYRIDPQSLKTYLDKVYYSAGVDWQVETDTFSFAADSDPFLDEASGLLQPYTEPMRKLQTAYRQARGSVDRNTCHIFVLNYSGVKNNRNTSGFMPRGKQFGYIFLGNIDKDEVNSVVAHELGHGLWKLRHTFDEAYGNTAKSTQKTTDNLMDYTRNAEHLAKWQWDQMSEPAIFDGILDSDEEGMRKNERERSQITRFIYALRNAIQDQIRFENSKILTTSDKTDILNTKTDYSVKADHIFYDELLSDYFEEVDLQIFFDAKNRQKNSPNELFFLRKVKKGTYLSWYIESLDAIITFVFTKETDIPKFKKFVEETDILLPFFVSSTRKAFFVHGTASDNERWLEHPLTENVLLSIANTDKFDDRFIWEEYNSLIDQGVYVTGLIYRNQDAQRLVDYVIANSNGFNEIVLIGHSHGGNICLQAANQLVNKGKTVYLISISTPAYNAETVEVPSMNILQNCDFIKEITKMYSQGIGTTAKVYEYKNPENPKNTKLKRHIHLWNKEDGVAGGFAGEDYYKPNGITENIEIPTEKEYSESIINITYTDGLQINLKSITEFMNAHGFDANRPQLIYKMLFNGKIRIIE